MVSNQKLANTVPQRKETNTGTQSNKLASLGTSERHLEKMVAMSKYHTTTKGDGHIYSGQPDKAGTIFLQKETRGPSVISPISQSHKQTSQKTPKTAYYKKPTVELFSQTGTLRRQSLRRNITTVDLDEDEDLAESDFSDKEGDGENLDFEFKLSEDEINGLKEGFELMKGDDGKISFFDLFI